jgi:glycosyltransferase domain-containing protein
VTPRLTIVLPLKGRHLFTLRFLWHANKARLPYRFLIADGEAHPELTRLLENSPKHFPALDIEYVRYPDDVDLRHFYSKMADALHRVRTPYVKVADNDDFLAPAGLEYCMGFLDAHADYICCSGGIAGFSVQTALRDSLGRVVGPLNKVAYHYTPRDRSIDLNSASATERVIAGLRNTWNYYAVFRTPVLALLWKEVSELGPTGFALAERYLTMRTLTVGKAQSDPTIFSYWRQYWTSMQLHWSSADTAVRRDFVYYLLRSPFTEDFTTALDRISKILADLDHGNAAEIADRLREILAEWVGDLIRLDFGAYATLRRHLRTYAPWFVVWLKTRSRMVVVLEKGWLLSKLRKNGATPEYIAKFKSELDHIVEVLSGHDFKAFLGEHMLKLQAPR